MNPYPPSRRLAQSASSTLVRHPTFVPPSATVVSALCLQQQQLRKKSIWHSLNPFASRRKKQEKDDLPSPLSSLDDPTRRQMITQELGVPKLKSSIFEEEVEKSRPADDPKHLQMAPEHYTTTMDPDPQSRERWERKMVIRMVHRNGRESRADIIARTEREIRHKSAFMPTSVKKLVKVANQIAGKRIDEALIQMAYSKKKVARDVKFVLERARDEAIAIHGMGLGRHNPEAANAVPRKIKTKDGEWLNVPDPTNIYVSEAWVNRGPWRGQRLIHMGRGHKSIWMRPSTGISVVLKEEKTRIRQYDERMTKDRSHGPFIHHKDRPVTAQRQYYTW